MQMFTFMMMLKMIVVVVPTKISTLQLSAKISGEHENADDVDVSASNHCGAS